MPSVTIVIATYRATDHLKVAIASALAQTRKDFEVIVSDDSADQRVFELVEGFADERVRYRSNPSRLGPAGNHWAAFAEARGRYISILNHDDAIAPTFLESLLAPLEADPSAVLAFCDHGVISGEGQPLPHEADSMSQRWGRDKLPEGRHQPFAHLVVAGTIPMAVGAVFDRACISNAGNRDFGGAYDLHLSVALAAVPDRAAYYIGKRLSFWRTHPQQLTSRPDMAWVAGELACWQMMATLPAFQQDRARVRREIAHAAYRVARLRLQLGRPGDAIRGVKACLAAWPWSWRPWALLSMAIAKGSRDAIARLFGFRQPRS